jgi:serine/threonine protein kinase
VDGEPFSLGLRRDADQALILGEPLGRGAMGVVRAVTRKSDGCTFALKTIPKAGPQSLAGQTPTGEAMTIWERKVRDEVSLHFALGASLDIVTLHDGFEDEAGVHLLIDLCDGGDLLSGASVAHSTEDEDNAGRSKKRRRRRGVQCRFFIQLIQRRRRELRGRMLDPFLGRRPPRR